VALAVALACCFAAPAEAAVLPAEVGAPVTGVAALADQSPVADAVDAAAGEPAAAVERVVFGAADTVAGPATPPAVDSAVETVAPPAPSQPAAPAEPAGPRHLVDHGIRADASAAIRARGTEPRPGRFRRQDGAPSRDARPTGPPTGSVTAKEAGGASERAVTGPVPSAPDDVSLDPASGGTGGSPASGASAAFSVGGSAVLLAAVFLAASGVRRRIPGHRAFCPPAAFVPLLERPG
jgi:hypothetical protein